MQFILGSGPIRRVQVIRQWQELRKSQWLETRRFLSLTHTTCALNFAVSFSCLSPSWSLSRSLPVAVTKNRYMANLVLASVWKWCIKATLTSLTRGEKHGSIYPQRKQKVQLHCVIGRKNGKIWWPALMTAMMEQKKKRTNIYYAFHEQKFSPISSQSHEFCPITIPILQMNKLRLSEAK